MQESIHAASCIDGAGSRGATSPTATNLENSTSPISVNHLATSGSQLILAVTDQRSASTLTLISNAFLALSLPRRIVFRLPSPAVKLIQRCPFGRNVMLAILPPTFLPKI